MKEARLITLNWKILSNVYPTNILLEKMCKSCSSKCETCHVEDYLEHFFFYCKRVRQLWEEIQRLIYIETGKNITLTVTDCLFGFYSGSPRENQLINKLIIIGKLCVSKYKYGKHPNIELLLRHELKIRNVL